MDKNSATVSDMLETTLRSPASRQVLAVETAGLSKSFGTLQAVAGVDLAIPRGTVFAVLGPNGAERPR
jgi:ABC-type sugar transport system ATPase subunit